MPKPQSNMTAAAVLSTWTDADTAMQIVGTSLGVFGPGLLDPEVALASETPLRNALFDVLLSLVEGSALDMRPTDDGSYAFHWRSDYAVAGLSPDTASTIDISAPSPYMAELIEMRRERDDALGRAQLAESLAEERAQLLQSPEAPEAASEAAAVPAVASTPEPRRAPKRAARKSNKALDPDVAIVNGLHATPAVDEPDADAPDVRDDVPGVDEIDIRNDEPEAPEPEVVEVAVALEVVEAVPVEALVAELETVEIKADDDAPVQVTKAQAKPKARTTKPKPKAAAPKPTKPRATKSRTTKAQTDEPIPSDVVYLTPPAPEAETDDAGDDPENENLDDDSMPRRAKWSGYTLDKPRMHLSSVDRLVDEA